MRFKRELRIEHRNSTKERDNNEKNRGISMLRGRDKFNKAKGIINHIVRFYSIFPTKLRTRWFVRHRNTNGNIGIVIRYALLKTLAKSIGDNVSIQPGAYIFNPKELEIGDNVSIHPMCYIEAWGGVQNRK